MRPIGVRFAGLPAVLLLALAACSSGSSSPSSGVLGATSAAGDVTISTSATTLGTFLVGPNDRTLYVFAKDGPGKSNCTEGCATLWPPLTVSPGGAISAPPQAAQRFGIITRSDGSTQVTYNHRPLYYYAQDTKAGDTNGDGIGGVWFVALANGAMPGASGAASSAGPGAASSS